MITFKRIHCQAKFEAQTQPPAHLTLPGTCVSILRVEKDPDRENGYIFSVMEDSDRQAQIDDINKRYDEGDSTRKGAMEALWGTFPYKGGVDFFVVQDGQELKDAGSAEGLRMVGEVDGMTFLAWGTRPKPLGLFGL